MSQFNTRKAIVTSATYFALDANTNTALAHKVETIQKKLTPLGESIEDADQRPIDVNIKLSKYLKKIFQVFSLCVFGGGHAAQGLKF